MGMMWYYDRIAVLIQCATSNTTNAIEAKNTASTALYDCWCDLVGDYDLEVVFVGVYYTLGDICRAKIILNDKYSWKN